MTPKPKLSEIKAARPLYGHEIDYLLDLVKRLGKALKWALQQTYDSSDAENLRTGKRDFHEGYDEARALLKELEL